MVTSPCDFYQPRQQRRKARSGKPAILIHISANARADACGCPCGCGRTLAKDHCGCQKPPKNGRGCISGVWEIQSNRKQPAPADAQWGVWHIVWGGGGFLPFPPLPSATPSCCGVLFFPLAASMPLSKLGLATRWLPIRSRLPDLALPHSRFP